ncbi:hypothetical protein N9H05_02210 [Flavobacteriaceae bacterium]|nr:hypothetical protein [Flavobacteriaceae bacterium]
MEKLKKLIYSVYYLPENLIYSVKYLPQILFFGSIGFFFLCFFFIVGGENLEAVVGKTIAEFAPRELIFFTFYGILFIYNIISYEKLRDKKRIWRQRLLEEVIGCSFFPSF